jgi:hypothetical protein
MDYINNYNIITTRSSIPRNISNQSKINSKNINKNVNNFIKNTNLRYGNIITILSGKSRTNITRNLSNK